MPTYGQEKYERETLARAEEINGEYEGRLSKAEAALIASEARVAETESKLADAAMIIKRLARMLGDSVTREQALDWLKRNGLEGSPLRSTLGDVTATTLDTKARGDGNE